MSEVVAPRSTMEICKGELDVLVIWDEMNLLRSEKLNKNASNFKINVTSTQLFRYIHVIRLYTDSSSVKWIALRMLSLRTNLRNMHLLWVTPQPLANS